MTRSFSLFNVFLPLFVTWVEALQSRAPCNLVVSITHPGGAPGLKEMISTPEGVLEPLSQLQGLLDWIV